MKEVVGVGQGAAMSTWKVGLLLMACSNEAVTIVKQNKMKEVGGLWQGAAMSTWKIGLSLVTTDCPRTEEEVGEQTDWHFES
jgi:hypothetical protein